MTAETLLTTLADKAAPENAALLVIDVQNDFCAPGGFFAKIGADIPATQAMLPRLGRLIDAARTAGVLVVFIRAIYDPGDLSAPMRERRLRRRNEMPLCHSGTWGAEFHVVLPRPDEPVVTKHRYSAMINTELDALLKRWGKTSLLLSGVATDTCVESTGRDAYFMDYYVTLVSDCCAAISRSDHSGALIRFERDYGPIVTADELIGTWTLRGTTISATG